jgi:hypothetical protein
VGESFGDGAACSYGQPLHSPYRVPSRHDVGHYKMNFGVGVSRPTAADRSVRVKHSLVRRLGFPACPAGAAPRGIGRRDPGEGMHGESGFLPLRARFLTRPGFGGLDQSQAQVRVAQVLLHTRCGHPPEG